MINQDHNRIFEQAGSTLDDVRLTDCQILVLGGGVSGLSTALTLQAAGFKTAIVAEHTPCQLPGELEVPLVASGYPMASAYPHNLKIENLDQVSDNSQAIFAQLSSLTPAAVQTVRLFEVYEQEPEASPPLASRRMEFTEFAGPAEQIKQRFSCPSRPGATTLWGWVFKTFFIDMPVYMPELWSRFFQSGGILIKQRIDSIASLPKRFNTIVNCCGYGSLELFDDPRPRNVMRGKQVLVPQAPPVVSASDGIVLAYNYTPPPEIFSRAGGQPEYVHFFSRGDGWLLGQTRESGSMTNDCWQGEISGEEMISIRNCQDGAPAVEIPSQILTLNYALLSTWTGARASNLNDRQLRARIGYRYYRDTNDKGVRLEAERSGDILVVHNYGHGGSGVTMSWGCAARCAELVLKYGKIVRTEEQEVAKHSQLHEPLARLVDTLAASASSNAE